MLRRYRIHLQSASSKRLYLPRKLGNVVQKSERIEHQLFTMLDRSKNTSLRRAAILKAMKNEKTVNSVVSEYLRARYKGDVNLETLYSEIKTKARDEKLYRAASNNIVDMKNSSLWLMQGNVNAQDEGYLCYLQDRNMFGGDPSILKHCKERINMLHLATQCNEMLGHEYTRRHNEVVKCIHLLLCNKYGIKAS